MNFQLKGVFLSHFTLAPSDKRRGFLMVNFMVNAGEKNILGYLGSYGYVFPCISHGPFPTFLFQPHQPSTQLNCQLPPCRKPPKRYANHVNLAKHTSVGHGVLIGWSCTTQKIQDVPCKGTMFTRKIAFQPSCCRGYDSFGGSIWCE